MRRARSLKLLACLLRRPTGASHSRIHACSGGRGKGKPSEAGSGWDWLRLLELWSEAGFDPDSFWRQTPRTLKAIMAGYSARVKWDHRERMSAARSEEHTSELQSLMRISYAVFDLKKKKNKQHTLVQANDIRSTQH